MIWLPVISLAACAQDKSFTSPAGYDFQKPVTYYMEDELQEISGIAFENGDPGLLYAEQDEEGKVFLWKPGEAHAARVDFGKKGDYEDIAIARDYVIVLRSDGTLFTFPLLQVKQGKITDTRKWEGLLPKGEYESLYADAETGQLVLLCKDSHRDHESGKVSGHVLVLDRHGAITKESDFQFDPDAVAHYTGKPHKEFKPSALTRNPVNGDWYILSSVNKVLVIAGENWQVKDAFPLDPSLFIQPEGIAFDAHHALYISNEGSKTKAATVFKFPKQGSH
jgi:hypothetical protein